MKIKIISLLSVGALVAMVAGCAGNIPAGSFPGPESATAADGRFVNVDNLRNVDVGLSKDQVSDLIGVPHFNEGVFAVRTWNYLFNFRSEGQVISCQYQVQFGEDKRVSGVQWRDLSCAGFVRLPAASVAPEAEVHADKETTEQLTVRSDALFPFGKSDFNQMKPAGREALSELVDRIEKYKKIVRVDVVGHTDRIGSPSANQRLSLARANAVRDYLVARGLDSSLINVMGAGSSQTVSDCSAGKSPSVIACLAPDRRVSIAINGVM